MGEVDCEKITVEHQDRGVCRFFSRIAGSSWRIWKKCVGSGNVVGVRFQRSGDVFEKLVATLEKLCAVANNLWSIWKAVADWKILWSFWKYCGRFRGKCDWAGNVVPSFE